MNRRRWRQLVVCACIAGATTAHAATATAAPLAPTSLPAPLGLETEVNDSIPVASPIMGDQRIRGALSVAGEVDYYRFAAKAGDRVFAATFTAGSMTAPADTKLTLSGDNGVTDLEADDNGGSLFRSASSIAGTVIPSDGTYYLRVEDARGAAGTPAPYDLYLALRSGVPAEEVEPNDEFNEANPLVNGEVRGVHEPGEHHKDWFAVNLQAGDTVFLSLDLDPERNGGSFDGEVGLGLAGDVRPPLPQQILTVDDAQSGETPDSTPSESMAMTVSTGGTYYGYVDVDSKKLDTGGPLATYDLAVSVFPATQPSCRTYSSALTSAFLDGGTTTFPIPVDDPALVGRAALRLNLEESVMADLDTSLRSPAGLELPLFTDIGDTAPGGQRQMEAVFDDFAAMPSLFAAVRPLGLQTDAPLAGFKGQQAQGTWALVVKDDTANSSAGNLTAAELVLCPEPSGNPGSPPGGGGGGGGAGEAPPQARPQPRPAPVLSGLTIAPGEFRAAKAGAMLLAKRPKGGGALVRYQSSEAVETNFVLFELEEGRRVGRKCARTSALNASKKPCVRPVKVISFVRNGSAGSNQFGFSGRVGARKLPPGDYQLQARAYAPSGLTSAPVAATFKVLPPAPKEASARRR